MASPVDKADVRFILLGQVAVTVDGADVPVRGVRRKALLASLVLHRGEVLSADRLVEQVWGDGATVGNATLQSHMSHLRRCLGPAAALLETRPPGYVLRAEPSAVDAVCFEQLVARGRDALAGSDPRLAVALFDQALALWGGRPLAELAELDFAHREADRLEQVRLGAVEDRIDAQLALGRAGALLPELEALVDQHPLRERLTAQLMLALYRSGRQAEALRVYQRARSALGELGIEPSPVLRDLESAILVHAPELGDPARSAAPVASLPLVRAPALPPLLAAAVDEPLVGRDRELEQLESAWREVRGGARRVVVVTGEAGVGKTALVAHAARRALGDGALVLAGRCDETHPSPYQPFPEALAGLAAARPPTSAAGRMVAELSRLVPDLASAAPVDRGDGPVSADAEWFRYRLFEATVAWFAAAGGEGPLVLVLDDLHWASAASLLLLRHLVRAPVAMSLLVLLTCRDTEARPEEVLDDVLADLARQPGVATLALTGLSQQDVAALVDRVEWAGTDKPAAGEVHARTGGNPFFVRELLTSRLAGGSVTGFVPVTVRQVIAQRVRRLSPPARRVLEIGAVLGATFSVRQLLALHRSEGTLDGVDEAVGARLLRAEDDQLHFAHALVRDALYQGLRTADRLELHLQVAQSLAGLDPERYLESVAFHSWAASPLSPVDEVVTWNRRAGERAMAALAFEEAVQYFERALGARRQAGGSPEEECELGLALARAQLSAGDLVAVEATLDRTVALARAHHLSTVLARAALTFEGELVTGGEVWERRLALLEDARRALGAEQTVLATRVSAMLAHVLAGIRPGPRVVAVSEEAVDLAARVGDEAALAAALHARHQALPDPGHAELRAELAADVVALASRSGSVAWEMLGRMAHLADLLELGRLEEFSVELDRYAAAAGDVRRPHDLWRSAVMRATKALFAGQLDRAEELSASALELGSRWQQPGAMQAYVVQLFLMRWHQGRAVELLEGAESWAASSPELAIWRCTLAALYAEAGREQEANALVEVLVADDFAALPRDNVWLVSLTMLTEAVARTRARALVAPLLEQFRPHGSRNVTLGTVAAFGSARRPIGMLEHLVGDLDAAASSLGAAVAANEAMGSALYAADARAGLAAVLSERGHPGDEQETAAARAAADAAAIRMGAARIVRACAAPTAPASLPTLESSRRKKGLP